jgi:hypothetical protein
MKQDLKQILLMNEEVPLKNGYEKGLDLLLIHP